MNLLDALEIVFFFANDWLNNMIYVSVSCELWLVSVSSSWWWWFLDAWQDEGSGSTKLGTRLWTTVTLCQCCCCLVSKLCLTLWDCSPPGSSAHGISQARILERVAISSSRDLSNPGIKPVSPAWNLILSYYLVNLFQWSEFSSFTVANTLYIKCYILFPFNVASWAYLPTLLCSS